MMTSEERHQRLLGEWKALNKVLNYLNTLDDKMINKSEIYEAVSRIRPDGYPK